MTDTDAPATAADAVGAGAGFGRLTPIPQRSSLADEVYDAVKSMLMDGAGAARPAGRLHIDELAEQLHVSSTPVRDALNRLLNEGLVRQSRGRGYHVAPAMTADEIDELFQFRMLVEPWAAGMAATTAQPADVAALTGDLSSVVEAMRGEDYGAYRRLLEHDQRFHDRLLALAGNELVRASLARCHSHVHLFRSGYEVTGWERTVAEHQAIVDRVADADPVAAAAAMTEHLEHARTRFLN